jgi:succinyl-diaminopimelate desuccinylase
MPSTADNPKALGEAVALVAARLAAQPGITVEHFEHNGKPSLLAYASNKRPRRFTVLLNGHVDVVPAKPEQFHPEEKDGKLYGRGALDMKAAALALTETFCEFAPKTSYPLGLQIVSDEEIGGHNGTLYQMAQGVQADFIIAGEFTPPSQICTASRGICQLRVRFTGKAAHGAYPWNGDNAAVQSTAFVTKLLEAYPIPPQEAWATTINVSSIAAPNTALNRVPAAAEITLDCRYVPEDKHFRSQEAVLQLVHGLNPACVAEFILFEPAHYTDEQHPLVQQLADALASVTGEKTTFIKKPGGSDVRFYSNKDMPAVVCGLQGQGIHGDHEYLELESLKTYRSALAAFLENLRA